MNFKAVERCDLIYISESSLSEAWRIYYSRTGLEARIEGGHSVNLDRAAEVQPWQDQEYPRNEWHRRGRRQTDTYTDGCIEEVAFFNL